MMTTRAPRLPLLVQLQCLLFISGFSALLLEVLYVKLLRYWAGNTAYAVAAVLSAYMTGLCGGAYASGRWLIGARRLLSIFGGMEFLVGVYSAALPWLMRRLEPAYLQLTSSLGPDSSWALLGHFLAGVLLLLLPTFLMGASFPVIVRAGSQGPADKPGAAIRLYAANLIGAALGTLLSEFLLIRLWGLANSLILVGVNNSLVAAWAVWTDRRQTAAGQPEIVPREPQVDSRKAGLVLFVALAGGFLVLFQEVVWTHMIGRFLDNTVYGFAVMLFAVIAGLGLGAVLVFRMTGQEATKRFLPWACLATGGLVMLLTPFWDNARVLVVRHPVWAVGAAIALAGIGAWAVAPRPSTLVSAFAAIAALLLSLFLYRSFRPSAATFWIHHGVEFAVCLSFMLVPAVLMGTIFPATMDWYLEIRGASRPTVAPVYAANTVGSLGGIVAATFLVLPRLGLERSAGAAGLALFALGLMLAAKTSRGRWATASAVVPFLAWVVWMPSWDFSKTHAVLGQPGRLLYSREDLNSGLTTVVRLDGTQRLYTNGLIQAGNDYLVPDQARIALVPMLHARETDRAMVIGLGSGQTAGIVALFPFESVELVDFSPGVVEAGKRFFDDLNLGVYHNSKAKVHIADGRHYLLTHPQPLSLLTMQVSRLWVAGEGDLYTREFYELCAARLGERGVLQQWVPLFRLSFQNSLMILRTVRAVFPQVALYVGEESGMIVASRSQLEVDDARLRAMDSIPQVKAVLARVGLPSLYSLLGDCVLVPEGVDALLAHEPENRISTDLWPHLEHSIAWHYLEGLTTVAARRFFLTAQEFRTVPIIGAAPPSLDAIRELVLAERNRQVASVQPNP